MTTRKPCTGIRLHLLLLKPDPVSKHLGSDIFVEVYVKPFDWASSRGLSVHRVVCYSLHSVDLLIRCFFFEVHEPFTQIFVVVNILGNLVGHLLV